MRRARDDEGDLAWGARAGMARERTGMRTGMSFSGTYIGAGVRSDGIGRRMRHSATETSTHQSRSFVLQLGLTCKGVYFPHGVSDTLDTSRQLHPNYQYSSISSDPLQSSASPSLVRMYNEKGYNKLDNGSQRLSGQSHQSPLRMVKEVENRGASNTKSVERV